MKNFVSGGQMMAITAAATFASGDGVLVGSIFGIAAGDIASGGEGNIQLTGVFDLPKIESQTWAVGVEVYWDESASQCTTVATDNSLIGVAVSAVGNGAGEVVGRVRLNGTSV